MSDTTLLWREFFADPSQWWDRRKRKKNSKAPDFKHRTLGQSLWIDGPNNPSWVKDMLEEKWKRDAQSLYLSSDTINSLWEVYFMDPDMWWDNRMSKKNRKAPDFKHKATKQSLWLEDASTPRWVVLKLEEELKSFAMGEVNLVASSPHNATCSLPTVSIKQDNNLSFSNTYSFQAGAFCRETEDLIDWDLLSTEQALTLLEQRTEPPSMDSLICILQKCRKTRSLVYAKRVHTYLCKNKMESQRMLGNYLVPMFVDCGGLHDAQQVFNKLVQRDEFSWSSLIHGYTECGDFQQVFKLYGSMQELGMHPSPYTFLSLLKACGRLKSVEKGQEIHHWIVALGFENENLIGNALVDMYAKFGSLTEARNVLSSLSIRDVVSWTAFIAGYADIGLGEEVWDCLEEMRLEGVSPDAGTHVCSLKAFSNAGAIDYGRDLHSQVIMGGYENDHLISNILVDMYAKCGLLMEAWEIFNKMPTQGVVSWTALIAGHARCGECGMAFELFEEMQSHDVHPNDATFLIILSVCSHAGMVEKGLLYFELMEHGYGITPSIKHHNCMLDLLCRSGQLNAAMLMLEKMPVTPNLVTWKTILSACRKWGNVEISKQALELTMQKDGNQASVFPLISNIFADANMWKDIKRLEKA